MSAEDRTFKEWVRQQVEAETYWFHRIELYPDLVTPGWSDPATEKMPYFGLPDDLTGLRVLDIGCADGYFSFEAERRGAREVVAIDSLPDSVRRFNVCRSALGSKATAYLANVYELHPRTFGTFDLILFYGVFYHLRHPHLALEKILGVSVGRLLFQSHILELPELSEEPWGKFHPRGVMSGKDKTRWDPTVFWLFNSKCCIDMVEAVGFEDVQVISPHPQPFVLTARSPTPGRGQAPDQTKAPWS